MSSLKVHNKGITYSLLSAVGAFDESNTVVLYGGALVDVVLRRENCIKDWDLRLIGPQFINAEETCVHEAKMFVDKIFRWIRQQNEQIQLRNIQRKELPQCEGDEETIFNINAVKVMRKMSTITVSIPATPEINATVLQFTFAPYASITELFQNSNPNCTRIAIIDGCVKLDEMTRYCLESLCVVVDTNSLLHCQTRSDDEEDAGHSTPLVTEIRRVIKYFGKGFDIILPDLDINKVDYRNLHFEVWEVLDLPMLTVIFDGADGNKFFVKELRIPDTALLEIFSQGNGGYDEDTNINSGTMIHHNVRCLHANVYDKFMFVTEGEMVSPIFDFCPTITPRMVDKVYETVKANLNSGVININEVIQYFSHTNPADVLEKLINAPIRTLTKKPRLSESFRVKEEDLDEIVAKEIISVLTKIEKTREKMMAMNLDKLVVDFFSNVSTESEIAKAIYGKYMVDTTE
jgi:hypothetical protein